MVEVKGHEKKILLLSNSTLYGGGYLDHAEKEIGNFLGAVPRVLFIPFAQRDRDAYAALARRRLAAMGYEMDSAHEASNPRKAVSAAEAVFWQTQGAWRRLVNRRYWADNWYKLGVRARDAALPLRVLARPRGRAVWAAPQRSAK